MKLSRNSCKIARCNATKLELIPEPALLNPDAGSLRSIPVNTFESEPVQDVTLEKSRTFGHKRIQFMLMPMMYKMGVMMTMLMLITAITAKGLFIGVILLVLKLSTFLAKFHSGWHHAPQPWPSPQPVHVHLHSGFPHAHPHVYQSWESSGPAYDDQYFYKG
ncbi:hypothetical protein PUN28_001092 [Cardiocondyla obscurior]